MTLSGSQAREEGLRWFLTERRYCFTGLATQSDLSGSFGKARKTYDKERGQHEAEDLVADNPAHPLNNPRSGRQSKYLA